MSTLYAILISLAACIAAAVLEGWCAGKNVRSYFAKLRFPPYSAPLLVWYIIGGLYYVLFFFLIYRILRHDGDTVLRNTALIFILFMMVANGLWNYVFFRSRNLRLSFISSSLAPIFDIALFVLLVQLDRLGTLAIVPYLLYRVYALWWGYRLWKFNRQAT